MAKQQASGLSNRMLAGIVCGIFILLAIVGPVFFSQPDHLYPQVMLSVLTFLIFMTLAGLQLGSRIRIRGWSILLVFVIGYVIFFLLRDGDFRPDQHWFIMSPLGWLAGALAFGQQAQKYATKNRPVVLSGVTVHCWSSAGRVATPPKSVETLISKLDGRNLTLVQLIKDTRCLEIAGGLHDRLVVYYSDDRQDDDAWFVYTEDNTTTRTDANEQLMFIGALEGCIPEMFWCSPERAQVLAAEFMNNGRVDTTSGDSWLHSGPMAGGIRPSLPGGS